MSLKGTAVIFVSKNKGLVHESVILAWTNKILKNRGTEETPFSRWVSSEPAGPGFLPCLPLVLLVIFVLLKVSLNTLELPD